MSRIGRRNVAQAAPGRRPARRAPAKSMPEENIGPSPRRTTHLTSSVGGGGLEAPRASAEHQLVVERVALLGAVEDDVADGAAVLGRDDAHGANNKVPANLPPTATWSEPNTWRRSRRSACSARASWATASRRSRRRPATTSSLREVDDATLAEGHRARSRSSSRARSRRASPPRRTPTPSAAASRARRTTTTSPTATSSSRRSPRTSQLKLEMWKRGRRHRQARGGLRHEHLVAGRHRPGRGDVAARALPRPALLQPGAGHEARRGHPRGDDVRRGVRGRRRLRRVAQGKLGDPDARTRRASSSTACSSRTCSTRSAPTRRASARSQEIDEAMKAGAGAPDGAADARRLRRARHARARSATSCSTSSASAASPSRRRCARCSPPAGTARSPAWASTTTRARRRSPERRHLSAMARSSRSAATRSPRAPSC